MMILNCLTLLNIAGTIADTFRWLCFCCVAILVVIILFLLALLVFANRQKIANYMNEIISTKITFGPKEKKVGDNEVQASAVNKSVVATGFDSPKQAGSQDYGANRFVQEAQAHIIAIADGLGKHPYSEEGSRFVVKKALDLIENELKAGVKDLDFDSLFQSIQKELDSHIEELLPRLPDSNNLKPTDCFGTTLIVGIDYTDRFVVAYIGNGAIFNISGYFADFPPVIFLPWNAINMLNPHTVERDGKEALYKLFSWQGNTCTPTVLEIRKNKEQPGEIFVLTTDGVYSADHSIPGKDSEGTIWIPSSRTTERLYDFLKAYMYKPSISEFSLEKAIKEQYLDPLKRDKEMDDCTTLGIVITEQCVDYFRKKQINLKKTKINQDIYG